jgi:hypothetical protein
MQKIVPGEFLLAVGLSFAEWPPALQIERLTGINGLAATIL